MSRIYRYTTSEAGNIIVVKTEGGLLIAADDKTYLVDDPNEQPIFGEIKTIEVGESPTIGQIISAIKNKP